MNRPLPDPPFRIPYDPPFRSVAATVVAAIAVAACLGFTTAPVPEGSSVVAEEIDFASGEARLRGTVYVPGAGSAHAALAVVHGSGQQTRLVHRDAAEFLACRGFVVLTYDKRGVGESTGSYRGVGTGNSVEMFEILAADALAAVRSLRERDDVFDSRVGLLGFSQAGWIIPLAASRDPSLAFAVIVSGPAVTVGEEIYYSALAGEYLGSPSPLEPEAIAGMLDAYGGPRGFDPIPSLEAMKAPGLWIYGGRDRSIPVLESVAVLERLRRQGGKDFTIRLYPSGNHGLFDLEAHRTIDFLPVVEAWLRQRVVDEPSARAGVSGSGDGS